MRIAIIASIVALSGLFGGCATITSSENQALALSAQNEKGEPVEKVACTLKNDKGDWKAEAPSFVNVHRSAEDLIVECKKDGYADGLLRAVSRAAGGMFGNIIFGGGIGAIIDHSKGTGYNYPDKLPVKMGQSVTVDRAEQQKPPADQAQDPPQQQTKM